MGIALNNTDVIEGGASVDAVIDYTISGVVGTTITRLVSGVLGTTLTTVLYTAATAIGISSIVLVNKHTSAVAVTLCLDPANGAVPRYLIPQAISLGAGYSLHTSGDRFAVFDASGNLATASPNYQPLDAELTALANLISAADKLPYFTGNGTASLADLTAAGRAILDDANAAAQRTTLGAAASGANADITSMTSLDDGGIPFSKVADLWVHFAKGYNLGGYIDAVTAVIEDLIFSSETSQAIAATLDTAKSFSASVNSSAKGYIMGGGTVAEYTAVIEDLIFSNETSQAIAATLDTAKDGGTGVQYGYI